MFWWMSISAIFGRRRRDHNPHAFTTWMSGGGVQGGFHYGATDRFGYKAVENRVAVRHLHAAILYLLDIDHERLTYHFNDRDSYLKRNPYRSASCTMMYSRTVFPINDATLASLNFMSCSRLSTITGSQSSKPKPSSRWELPQRSSTM